MNMEEFVLNDYKYTVNPLKLLSEPLPTSRLILIIAPYSKLEVVACEKEWVKVKYNDQEGFIPKIELSVTKETMTTAPLKPQPKEKIKSMGKIPKSTRVEVIESHGEWCQIFDGKRLGYVQANQLGDCQVHSMGEDESEVHRPKHKSVPHINLFK